MTEEYRKPADILKEKYRTQRAEWEKESRAAEEGSKYQSVCRRMVQRLTERLEELEGAPQSARREGE